MAGVRKVDYFGGLEVCWFYYTEHIISFTSLLSRPKTGFKSWQKALLTNSVLCINITIHLKNPCFSFSKRVPHNVLSLNSNSGILIWEKGIAQTYNVVLTAQILWSFSTCMNAFYYSLLQNKSLRLCCLLHMAVLLPNTPAVRANPHIRSRPPHQRQPQGSSRND